MDDRPNVPPLSRRTRSSVFLILVFIFLVSLPFLYLYATGYRFDLFEPTNIYSTGGLYIAVERAGAEIYIDGELVRETRAFRRAFYAQNIEPGTHRVHVQKEGYHTWVKELPVTAHRVTEAESFNLPLIPHVRVIAPWQTATGTMILRSQDILASTTNPYLISTSTATSSALQNTEYLALISHFTTITPTTSPQAKGDILSTEETPNGSTSSEGVLSGTTTKERSGVRLYEEGEEVYARWTGSFEQMPYYYCAPDFPRYSSTTAAEVVTETSRKTFIVSTQEEATVIESTEALIHPVESIPEDSVCNPVIRLDRQGQEVTAFDFFPGSTDLVILARADGMYVVEIDDRAWQNAQPLILGEELIFHIENNGIYVYDGTLIYQVIFEA
jgi:hypothetical protein